MNPPHDQPTQSSNPDPRRPRRKRRWLLPFTVFAVIGLGGASYAVLSPRLFPQKRPDVLLHKVRFEQLPVTVVEKGTLESAENRDIVCKVKAGSKGTFASTIKWVIDDGSIVRKGDRLIDLDDSSLQDQRTNQRIAVDKARSEFIKADEELKIAVKSNDAAIATAESALAVAELDLDKYLGRRSEAALNPFGAAFGAPATLIEKGLYRQSLDDVSARLKQAESDLDSYRERSAWADRSSKMGYQTPTQARAEAMKLSGALDNVEKLRKEKFILETFTRDRELTDLRSKFEVARIGVEKAALEAKSKEVQADSVRRTAMSVLVQEEDKLREIEEQIKECRIHAPQDGMVVYYKPESSRFGSSSGTQGMIAQGEQVKEGQKLMRLPDLRRMQVNTRVHEAQVARVKGDDRRSTGIFDAVKAGLLTNTDFYARVLSHSDFALETVQAEVRDKEYYIANRGMRASVKVDAFPDRLFSGRVKSVAAVAAQTDWGSSDVKVYTTLVLIEETVDGLRPDMNAEVTIHVDDSMEPVLAVPIQAVVGGAESGPKRSVYVMRDGVTAEQEVKLGKFNDKLIEVRDGLKDGDEVVINPKVLLAGSNAKTREEGPTRGAANGQGGPPGAGGEGGEKKGKKGGAGGGKGMPGGGPPGGGMPGGGGGKGGPPG